MKKPALFVLGFAGLILLWQMFLMLHRADLPRPDEQRGVLKSLPNIKRKDVSTDWRPPWIGEPVDADVRGYGSDLWKRLAADQSDVSAADVARQLLDFAKGRGRNLVVVQVGACDGAWEETNDPMQALLSDDHTKALVVEPVPPNFEELQKSLRRLPVPERLEARNVAVCLESKASVPFYVVSPRFAEEHPESPHWAKKELASFDKRHLRKHHIPEEYIDIINVRCESPSELLAELGAATVDAALVDAEGLDGDLVLGFLAIENFRPSLIVFEQKHLKAKHLEHVLAELRGRRYVHWQDKDQLVAVLAAPALPVVA